MSRHSLRIESSRCPHSECVRHCGAQSTYIDSAGASHGYTPLLYQIHHVALDLSPCGIRRRHRLQTLDCSAATNYVGRVFLSPIFFSVLSTHQTSIQAVAVMLHVITDRHDSRNPMAWCLRHSVQ
jgi:hypothetical protein